MQRALMISLSLILTLACWNTAGTAGDFYVIPTTRGNYAPVAKTGQTTSYATGDDGALQKGVAWPTPRFTDNNNGTVTDNLTGLIWTKNANIFGTQTWTQALADANGLASGTDGLIDGSKPGDWRLPNVRELQSLIDYGVFNPPLPNTFGTGQWAPGDPFTDVQSSYYWSSSTLAGNADCAWGVDFIDGYVSSLAKISKVSGYYVWCVRGGK